MGAGLLKRAAVVLVALALPASVAACGSSDETATSESAGASTSASTTEAPAPAASSTASADAGGVEAAQAAVEQGRQEVTGFTAPGPALDATSLSGGSIWYIPVSASIPALQIEAAGIKEGAEAAGLKYETCDGKFVPASASACIKQAVNAGATGIITDSVDPATVGPALASAKAKQIPVIAANAQGTASEDLQFVSMGDVESQPLAMNWIIADSQGDANILAVTISGDGNTVKAADVGLDELKKNCPECQYDEVALPVSQIPKIPENTSSALLKNPDVNYGFPEFDFLAPQFQRGMQQAGRTNKLKMVSTNAVLSQMQQIKSGKQVADIGANRNYIGWTAMDRLLRMKLDLEPPTEAPAPVRVFDETNIDSIDLSEGAAADGSWWGPTTYKDEFKKLWGLG
jgi:ribose transport system substrate-binding protein